MLIAQLPPDSHCARRSHTLPVGTAGEPGSLGADAAGLALVPTWTTRGFGATVWVVESLLLPATTPSMVVTRQVSTAVPAVPSSTTFSWPTYSESVFSFCTGGGTVIVSVTRSTRDPVDVDDQAVGQRGGARDLGGVVGVEHHAELVEQGGDVARGGGHGAGLAVDDDA